MSNVGIGDPGGSRALYDYPMTGVFWTLTLLAFWVLWVMA
jgi:hypothetical protein